MSTFTSGSGWPISQVFILPNYFNQFSWRQQDITDQVAGNEQWLLTLLQAWKVSVKALLLGRLMKDGLLPTSSHGGRINISLGFLSLRCWSQFWGLHHQGLTLSQKPPLLHIPPLLVLGVQFLDLERAQIFSLLCPFFFVHWKMLEEELQKGKSLFNQGYTTCHCDFHFCQTPKSSYIPKLIL